MKKISNFLKEVREELKKVSWPSREQTLQTTLVVVVVVAIITVYLGALDFVLARITAAVMGY